METDCRVRFPLLPQRIDDRCSRKYPAEDKNGNKRTAFEIVAEEVSFCGSKAETGTGARQNEQPARVQPAASFATGGADDFEEIPISDDLPF